MADADFEEFFGAGGAVGLFPTFRPKRVPTNGGTDPDGFNADGDKVRLPTATGASATLSYLDASSSIVWSAVPTDIDASADEWITFNLDSVDNLLWVWVLDTGANRVYTATIDAAGTIVNAGDAVPAKTLSTVQHTWITTSTQNGRGGSAVRATQGTGNFTLRLFGLLLEIDSADGSIVTETEINSLEGGAFLSTSGLYFSAGSNNDLSSSSGEVGSAYQQITISGQKGSKFVSIELFAPNTLGLPLFQQTDEKLIFPNLQWRGEIVIQAPHDSSSTGTFEGVVVFDPTELKKSVDTLITNFRLDQ